MQVPALITASWYDVILGHDLEHFARMRRTAATDRAREQTRLLIGPWSHGMFLPVVGDLDFGRRAAGSSLDLGVDLGAVQAEWFASQLGEPRHPTGGPPRVRLFVQGVNRWRDEHDWPPTPRCRHRGTCIGVAGSAPSLPVPTTARTPSCSTRAIRARRAVVIS